MSRPFVPHRRFQPREPLHRRNGKIRAREIRVIDETKTQLGIMSLNDALRLAQSRNLDLVEIVPHAQPPVCRIINYGKFLYEESKRESTNRPQANRMKEIQISAVIGAHDLQTKRAHAAEFLSEDMKVRVKLRFRGRQRAHKEVGFEVMNRFVQDLAAHGQADAPPKLLGERDLSVVISPLPRAKRASHPAARKTPPQLPPPTPPGDAPASS